MDLVIQHGWKPFTTLLKGPGGEYDHGHSAGPEIFLGPGVNYVMRRDVQAGPGDVGTGVNHHRPPSGVRHFVELSTIDRVIGRVVDVSRVLADRIL